MTTDKIEFIDLAAQQARIKDKLDARIQAVLAHGKYIMGPEVGELEKQLCEFTGARHCITCASGTDALVLALLAIGIKPGDAVFVPSFTFVATAEAVALLGAIPVFVDVDPVYFLLDLNSLKDAIEYVSKQEMEPRAIIPVDLFGQPADYDSINQFAEQHNLTVIADAAQSFGGELNGNKVGTLAPITTTSFFPAKPLGCYGDGGAVFTDDDNLADRMQSLRVHGKGKDKYDNIRIGINGRLDTLQAAILLEKLAIFPDEIRLRNEVADRYAELLNGNVKTPSVRKGAMSAWAQYTLQVEDRGTCQDNLKQAGIPTAVYYPLPLHQQTAYEHYPRPPAGLKVSEELSQRVFSLPMHPYLTEAMIERITAVSPAVLSKAKVS
ncbi:MAG: DegT/DnrJ/EryC1/StrS aminotransferase family protein [Gammaproteobacteria bacterium]